MKFKINSLPGAALALLVLTLTTNAATEPCATGPSTQVYDLKTDWSDTQNPNGTWSYVAGEDFLLLNNPFPWAVLQNTWEGIIKLTGTSSEVTGIPITPGFLEIGDIYVLVDSEVRLRWTAPANGTITVSGGIWTGSDAGGLLPNWMLTHNGTALSATQAGLFGSGTRFQPLDFSLGSGGAAALQNISVQSGDRIELVFSGLDHSPTGLNFTITLTTDSIDPVAAIENLAITVFAMNLQNGIENSLDSKLDAALNALVDANVNNDGAACNSLGAFINAVEAQRGNKISGAQADQLIAAAQGIQCMLNCGN